MKKGCKPYKPNSKNAYISSKNFLVAKGLIDKFLNIIDTNEFRKEVIRLTQLAKDKYDVNEGPLFGERTISSADKSYYQAVPNKKAFNKIDGVKKKAQPKQDLTDYYMGDQALREQEERDLNQEILLHLSNELSSKFGFDNPEVSSGPSIEDIINRSTTITQADIDNKKLDC